MKKICGILTLFVICVTGNAFASVQSKGVFVNSIQRAIKHYTSANNVCAVDVFYDSNVTDYGDVSTTGSIAWAYSQMATHLAAGGYGTVRLVGGDTYGVQTSIEVPSNTTLDLGGGKLQLASGATEQPILQNESFDSVVAGTATARSTDTNIIIKNGRIDQNEDNITNSADPLDQFAMFFALVDGLAFQDLILSSGGSGGKYLAHLHLIDNLTIENINFDGANSDGIHCSGGGKNHNIRNVRGACGDDFLAYTIGDITGYVVANVYADFENIIIRDLHPVGTDLCIVKLAGGKPFGTGGAFTTDFAVDPNQLSDVGHGLSNGDCIWVSSTDTLPAGLSASTDYYVVNSATDTFEVSTTRGGAPVTLTDDGVGVHSWTSKQYYYTNVLIDGIVGYSDQIPFKLVEQTATGNLGGFYGKNISIKNFLNQGSAVGSLFLQVLFEDLGGTIDVLSVDMSGAEVNMTNVSPFFFKNGGDTTATIGTFNLSNVKITGTDANSAIDLTNTDLSIFNQTNVIYEDWTTAVSQPNGDSSGIQVFCNNVQVLSCSQGYRLRDTATIYLSNVYSTNLDNTLILGDNAGSVINIYGTADFGNDGKTVRATAGSLYIWNGAAGFMDDVTLSDGQMMYNKKTTITCDDASNCDLGYYYCNGTTWFQLGADGDEYTP